MKRIATTLLLALIAFSGFAQTDGLSYQAVIIDPKVQELPGQNLEGNVLANAAIQMRFTILDSEGNVSYAETQDTQTDAFGMINLIIGNGTPFSGNTFTDISWDGTPKDLRVEVQIDGTYNDLGTQELTFIPYAFHRDIIASGNLTVDGGVLFRDHLEVDGTTTLNDNLSVNNQSETRLSGNLIVAGATTLNNSLDVTADSPTVMTGTLDVDGATTLNSSLEVEGSTRLNNTLDVAGATQLDQTLTVSGATLLENTLEVEGITTLRNELLVDEASATILTGTLRVDGETNLNADVNINNGSTLNLSGDLVVEGSTLFNDDLTVNGITNLNNELNVNNNSPSNLSGILDVTGFTTLNNQLQVFGPTNLENELNVNLQSPTNLSGSLTVDQETNLESSLSVNNGSPTFLSGELAVGGNVNLNNNLAVNGETQLNNALFVNNGSPTTMTGTLTVDGATDLNNTLIVDGATTLNNDLVVANASASQLTGDLTVDGITTLNNDLEVTNAGATTLTGTLDVDGITTLNNDLEVANASTSNLSGSLTVDGETTLNDILSVQNGSATTLTGTLQVGGETTLFDEVTVANNSPTELTGTLQVDGTSTFNDAVTANGATTINNDLTVTGNTILGNLTTETINIQSDNANHLAVFDNLNTGNGDGILIKLGRTHGALLSNGSIASLPNPVAAELNAPLNILKNRLETANANPTLTVNEMIQLAPAGMQVGGVTNINNLVFNEINRELSLPIAFPTNLTIPAASLLQERTIFPGASIPFVNIDIPRWYFPSIGLPANFTIPVPSQIPNPTEYVPALPVGLPVNGLPNGNLPPLAASSFPNLSTSLTKENEYITFQDVDGRKTGTIRAQSFADFRDNTIFDNVYVLNILADFVGIDLVDGVTSGVVAITNLIDEFNDLGVEYSSGNGDYAEWLERSNVDEYISAGDIVAVSGGKITKDLTEVEQIMVVSHRPIILGNTPSEGSEHLGNNVAFMGQVPVKVLGPVKTGDYIVADTQIRGYGKAISPRDMTAEDFVLAVGRSWEENLADGPKMINTVVGVHNGDWAQIIQKIERKQKAYEAQFKQVQARVQALSQKADQLQLNAND